MTDYTSKKKKIRQTKVCLCDNVAPTTTPLYKYIDNSVLNVLPLSSVGCDFIIMSELEP